MRAVLDPGRVTPLCSKPKSISNLSSAPAQCFSYQSYLRFRLSRHAGYRIIHGKNQLPMVLVKAVLDSVRVDEFESNVRNPSISTSYRNPNLAKPNQTVLDAQAKVCTGPTQTRPLSEVQAFKVLETILKSGKGKEFQSVHVFVSFSCNFSYMFFFFFFCRILLSLLSF